MEPLFDCHFKGNRIVDFGVKIRYTNKRQDLIIYSMKVIVESSKGGKKR